MFRFILIALASLFFAACSSSQVVTKTPIANTQGPSEYKIGVSDILSVVVWKAPELSIESQVRPDGRISVPLGGDILASGKAVEELSADITTKLSAYVRTPVVTVIVRDPVSAEYARRIRITGAVELPQSALYREGMTVLDLVLLAGGLTEFAKGNSAKLYRTVDNKTEVYPINISDILKKGDIKTNYLLSPSDMVTVPERTF